MSLRARQEQLPCQTLAAVITCSRESFTQTVHLPVLHERSRHGGRERSRGPNAVHAFTRKRFVVALLGMTRTNDLVAGRAARDQQASLRVDLADPTGLLPSGLRVGGLGLGVTHGDDEARAKSDAIDDLVADGGTRRVVDGPSELART